MPFRAVADCSVARPILNAERGICTSTARRYRSRHGGSGLSSGCPASSAPNPAERPMRGARRSWSRSSVRSSRCTANTSCSEVWTTCAVSGNCSRRATTCANSTAKSAPPDWEISNRPPEAHRGGTQDPQRPAAGPPTPRCHVVQQPRSRTLSGHSAGQRRHDQTAISLIALSDPRSGGLAASMSQPWRYGSATKSSTPSMPTSTPTSPRKSAPWNGASHSTPKPADIGPATHSSPSSRTSDNAELAGESTPCHQAFRLPPDPNAALPGARQNTPNADVGIRRSSTARTTRPRSS